MTANDFVAILLRSPLHVFLGRTMLITVTGRRTGRLYTTPVGYNRKDNTLWVISGRERTWWRNLQGGAQVQLRLHGKDVTGFGETILDVEAVAAQLAEYFEQIPMAARGMGVRIEDGRLNPEDAARVARERLFIKIKI